MPLRARAEKDRIKSETLESKTQKKDRKVERLQGNLDDNMGKKYTQVRSHYRTVKGKKVRVRSHLRKIKRR